MFFKKCFFHMALGILRDPQHQTWRLLHGVPHLDSTSLRMKISGGENCLS